MPIFREDVNNKNDIAEEVIRFYGYDKINSTLFERAKQTRGGVPQNFAIIGAIKSLLRDRGLSEIVTYSFTTQDYFTKLNLLDDEYCMKNIKLMNPLGEQLSVMRTTLVHSMLETVALNLSKGNKRGELFEIAKVYLPKSLPLESLPLEEERISVALYGANEDFFTLKNIVEAILQKTYIAHEFVEGNLNYMHPYRCAEVKSDNISIGYLGEIHPDILKNYGIKTKIYIAELNMEYIKNNFKTYLPYKKLVKFPAAERDLAIIVDNELASGNIIKTIKKAGGKILEDVSVFDVYCGQQIDSGKKSIAFSLTFRASDRTLGESEINNAMNKIIKEVEKEFSAKLR